MKKGLEPLISDDCRILILGSMPGEKSLETGQYYANRGNQFRKLVFDVFGVTRDDSYTAFVDVLQRNGIGLWNVIAHCQRSGSADHRISHAVANDLEALYERFPQIRHVFFESISASKFHDRLLKRRPTIEYGILPSTSGLNSRMSYSDKLEKWSILKQVARVVSN